MTKKKTLFLALTGLLVAGGALAESQLVGLAAAYWSHNQTLNASTAACITQTDGTTCQLFPAGTDALYNARAVVATTSGVGGTNTPAVRCCVVYDSALDIAASGQITDAGGPNGTGDGDCFDLPTTGSLWQGQFRRAFHQELAGYRGGLCPNRTLVHDNASATEFLHAPCASGSCPAAYGGGTCNTSPSSAMVQHAAVFLNCEGTQVHVRKEQVPGWSP